MLGKKPVVEAAVPFTPERLLQYQNAKVTVFYTQPTYSDTGRITYMDDVWVELTKDNGQRLLMPIIAIRIINLLEPGHLVGDAAVLLRPVEASEEIGKITS